MLLLVVRSLFFAAWGFCSLSRASSLSGTADHFLDELRSDVASGRNVDVDTALLHCERMFDQHKEEVSFLKLYGELLLERDEELGLGVLEVAVELFEQELQRMQRTALGGVSCLIYLIVHLLRLPLYTHSHT
jgi:hypothetical protein